MKAIVTIGLIPLFSCWLCAQTDQPAQTETSATTTTMTTYNGTLVDESCHNTRTEHHESTTTSNPAQGSSTTTKSDSTRVTSECPVTTTTRTFGLLTPDGQYMRFDEPSNTRIVEVVKGNKSWSKYMDAHQPVRVRVVGSKHGNVVVLDTIE